MSRPEERARRAMGCDFYGAVRTKRIADVRVDVIFGLLCIYWKFGNARNVHACMKCAEKLYRIFRLKLSERCAKSLINETFCFGRYGLQRYENYMHENYMKYNCRVTAILIFVIDRRIESLYTALYDILCVQVFRSLFTL